MQIENEQNGIAYATLIPVQRRPSRHMPLLNWTFRLYNHDSFLLALGTLFWTSSVLE